jgi:hypothetical protein
VDELRDRVAFLERELEMRTEENRRKEHLLAAALERIPALEPPESPETPSEPVPNTEPRSGEGRRAAFVVTAVFVALRGVIWIILTANRIH